MVVDCAAAAARAGVDMIQIREKDLSAKDLLTLATAVTRAVETHSRVLVNDRADIAIAAGAIGVHLTTRSLPTATVRKAFPSLVVGVSTHSADEVIAAGVDGADFVVCGPAFDTPSKAGLGHPLGLTELDRIGATSPVPVLALGGILIDNVTEALATRIAGIAAIRLFQEAWIRTGESGLGELVTRLKSG